MMLNKKFLNARHLMIDIETFGIGGDAPVYQIGATTFSFTEPGHDVQEYEFCENINIVNQVEKGARLDPETMKWHAENNTKNFIEYMTGPKAHEKDCLVRFANFVKATKAEFVWANGLLFDIAKIQKLFDLFGVEFPDIAYNKYVDMRFLRQILPEDFRKEADEIAKTNSITEDEQQHDALTDANWQAEFCKVAIDYLKNKGVSTYANDGYS